MRYKYLKCNCPVCNTLIGDNFLSGVIKANIESNNDLIVPGLINVWGCDNPLCPWSAAKEDLNSEEIEKM